MPIKATWVVFAYGGSVSMTKSTIYVAFEKGGGNAQISDSVIYVYRQNLQLYKNGERWKIVDNDANLGSRGYG